MNIKLQGIDLLGNLGLKSTQDRLNRQAERDNKIAFFEQQKENLKNMKADTIDEIARKLDLFHGYEDQIAAAKMEYNNSQMFHVFDEAQELAEKIAEAAEKNKPKTSEERREDMIEEATGVENDGMLDELMDNLTEAVEEVTEEMVEELQETSEEALSEEELEQAKLLKDEQFEKLEQEKDIPENYKPFDYRI
ncbi:MULTISPECIES: hypothetical protein [Pseudobutyrivibrio]|uniref:Uncharacterized protein n=1 Tax=Pseudobutyrivibrio xylanivorans DSM 14809 TaxID=1123012 RepID=A0A1M6LDG1_PSEXY|nr:MULTISPECIES: hypothetical protein [Pseudobutyrivibrio]SDH30995.1 hypothetical protein SAMN05421493_101282 [Pseudobutyrivibrio sp. 49]SHJ69187.1 hypothetical protein SAMN02745725_03081 [Pseudobutyrivibrio xylanivorans DSM 14809]